MLGWGGLACVAISILLMVFHWFDTAGKGAFVFLLGITGLMSLVASCSIS